MQGVVNTFVIFLSRIVGHFVDRVILKNERGHGIGYWVASLVAQILLGILASAIVCWFSRRREFRADEGGALYAGRENMIAALEGLKRGTSELPAGMEAMGISGGKMAALFSTHPPLDARIAALRESRG
jgi:heat shock protein HtpX